MHVAMLCNVVSVEAGRNSLVTISSRSLHIFMHSARVRAVLESFETTTTDLNLAFLSHIYNSLAEHFHGGPVTLFNPFTPVIT